MAESDGLGHLQMREAGHDRIDMLLGKIDEGADQGLQIGGQQIQLLACIKAYIGCNLVVARSRGMQLLSSIADQGGQPVLDIGVNVFKLSSTRTRPNAFLLQSGRARSGSEHFLAP